MTRSTCDGSVSRELKRSNLKLYWFTSRIISNHGCLLQRHWNGVMVHGFFMSLCFGSDWKLQSLDKQGWEISSHCTKWTGAFKSSFNGIRHLEDRRQEQNMLWFLCSAWERKQPASISLVQNQILSYEIKSRFRSILSRNFGLVFYCRSDDCYLSYDRVQIWSRNHLTRDKA